MSIRSINGLKQPLTLNGDVDFLETLSCKDIYVSGTITGAGYDDAILAKNNTWTGTNDFTGGLTSSDTTAPIPANFIRKDVADQTATDYNPTGRDNNWAGTATFSVENPSVPGGGGTAVAGADDLVNYQDLQYSLSQLASPLTQDNTFTGTNDFTSGEAKLVTIVPNGEDQIASKAYVDGVIEVAGKTLTYSFTSPGTYKISQPAQPIGNIARIDALIYSAGVQSQVYASIGNTPGFQSVSVGNGNLDISSYVINVGEKQTSIPQLTSTTSADILALPNSSSVTWKGQIIACVGGAYIDVANNLAVQSQSILAEQQTKQQGFSVPGISVSWGINQPEFCLQNVSRNVGTSLSNGRVDIIVHYT